MAQISALFSQMDVDGNGTLSYNELHRMLRVGKAAENSRYLRRLALGLGLGLGLGSGLRQ